MFVSAVFCVARVKVFLCFHLSVPVQLIAQKDSSPIWRVMCVKSDVKPN